MKVYVFAKRNAKEIVRDPLNLMFGIGFPVIILLLMTTLQKSILDMPAEVFALEQFAPGMIVFGLSFIALFLGMLLANDRNTSFLHRLFSSPLTSKDYILGYTLPILPIALIQCVVSLGVAYMLGLKLSISSLQVLVVVIPVSLLFISMGLLLGIMLNTKQVGGAGSIIVNAAAWLSGTWFSLDMVGGTYKKVCEALPFAYCVNAMKAGINGQVQSVVMDLVIVLLYASVLFILASYIFNRRMSN